MTDHVDYQGFVSKLEDFVDRGVTASLKLVTDDQHSLWIGVEDGDIISLRYGPWTGQAAVKKLEQLTGGNLTVDPKLKLPQMLNLPATVEVMQRLRAVAADPGLGTYTPDLSEQTGAKPAGTEEVVADKTLEAGFSFDAAGFLVEVRRYLTGVLGPIASVMVDNGLNAVGGLTSEQRLQAFIAEMRKEADGFIPLEQFDQDMETLSKGFRRTG